MKNQLIETNDRMIKLTKTLNELLKYVQYVHL